MSIKLAKSYTNNNQNCKKCPPNSSNINKNNHHSSAIGASGNTFNSSDAPIVEEQKGTNMIEPNYIQKDQKLYEDISKLLGSLLKNKKCCVFINLSNDNASNLRYAGIKELRTKYQDTSLTNAFDSLQEANFSIEDSVETKRLKEAFEKGEIIENNGNLDYSEGVYPKRLNSYVKGFIDFSKQVLHPLHQAEQQILNTVFTNQLHSLNYISLPLINKNTFAGALHLVANAQVLPTTTNWAKYASQINQIYQNIYIDTSLRGIA